MKLRRLSWLLFVAILALMLAACGGGGDDGGDGGVDLSQSYDNEGLSFNYPEGWVVLDNGFGQVMLASNQETLDLMTGGDSAGPPSSQVGVSIMLMPMEEAGMGDDVTPMSVMEMLLPGMQEEGEAEFTEPSEETIEDKATARVEGSDENVQAAIIIVDIGNGTFVMATGAAAPGELDDFNDEINAIIGTMSYSAP